MKNGWTTPERLLRLQQVIAPDGPIPVSRSTWWRGVKDGRYPQPVIISERIRGWRESEITALYSNDNAPSNR
ncbi:helix-turn-helix transcriptional regulator [Aquabacter cavernae]|jgi:prophage regulatory protein|uniref:helix-turn-helix transcriptional regulator n=1 Tax=Aquabacter cavernae TaxID=2496029 RepID=UPI000F8D30A6|nr:AlpA family phage regulatory protein [Aquabacter cavernae]